MRKVIDILNELPEPYRSQAVENVKVQRGDEILNIEIDATGKSIVMTSFNWIATRQGEDYWYKFYKSL